MALDFNLVGRGMPVVDPEQQQGQRLGLRHLANINAQDAANLAGTNLSNDQERLKLQQAQQAIADEQRIRELAGKAVKRNPDGSVTIDDDAMISGLASIHPKYVQPYIVQKLEREQKAAALKKEQLANTATLVTQRSGLLNTIHDPVSFENALTVGQQNGWISPAEAAAYRAAGYSPEMQAKIDQQKQAGFDWLKQTEEQRKQAEAAQNAQKAGDAHTAAGDVHNAAVAQLPEQQAKSRAEQLKSFGQAMQAVGDQAAYEALLKQYPDMATFYGAMFSPELKKRAVRGGMTANEGTTADMTAARDGVNATHVKNQDAQGWANVKISQGRLDLEKQKVTGALDDVTANMLAQAVRQGKKIIDLLPGNGVQLAADRRKVLQIVAHQDPNFDYVSAMSQLKADEGSLSAMTKNIDQVEAFENTALKNLDVLLTNGKKMIDTGSPFLNLPAREASNRIFGSKRAAAFNTARETAISEISKVLASANAAGGTVTDSQKKHIDDLIAPGATWGQIMEAANILKTDMNNRRTSYADQQKAIQNRIKNRGGAPAAGSGRPPLSAFEVK
jgi:hypothetical protein